LNLASLRAFLDLQHADRPLWDFLASTFAWVINLLLNIYLPIYPIASVSMENPNTFPKL
jgi:hypothetical protein